MGISEKIYRQLEDWVPALSKVYSENLPFPHIVFDQLMEEEVLKRVESSFPKPTEGHWWKYDNALEKKLARNASQEFSASARDLVAELNSHRFVSFLEKLTGIPGLIVDHTLNGGGLHQIVPGGKLDIHADYNYHPITKLDRRLNVLLYLNSQWESSWNGQLELWDQDMMTCVKSIEPVFNRMVIFSTTDTAYHGHPEPLRCPEFLTRKSIALYYYTNGRPEHERSAPHSTIFKRRPWDPIVEIEEEFRKQRAQRRI